MKFSLMVGNEPRNRGLNFGGDYYCRFWCNEHCLQCFDAVGWATGSAFGL